MPVHASMKGRPLRGGDLLRRLSAARTSRKASMKGRPLRGGDSTDEHFATDESFEPR